MENERKGIRSLLILFQGVQGNDRAGILPNSQSVLWGGFVGVDRCKQQMKGNRGRYRARRHNLSKIVVWCRTECPFPCSKPLSQPLTQSNNQLLLLARQLNHLPKWSNNLCRSHRTHSYLHPLGTPSHHRKDKRKEH